jgi:hypothetical protein
MKAARTTASLPIASSPSSCQNLWRELSSKPRHDHGLPNPALLRMRLARRRARALTHEERPVAKSGRLVQDRWRIVETEMWDQKALDLVVPAHFTLERNGMGEMQLIAIGASIDYRLERRGGATVIEFSWSGFDEMDPASGRGWATLEGDTMRGKLFIHQGDESGFTAKRESADRKSAGSTKRLQPRGPRRASRGPARRRGPDRFT